MTGALSSSLQTHRRPKTPRATLLSARWIAFGACFACACASPKLAIQPASKPVANKASRASAEPILQVAISADNACTLTTQHGVRCFGKAATVYRPALARAVSQLRGVRKVVTSALHSCAIDGQQRLWCWGDNRDGALGPHGLEERADDDPDHPGGDAIVPVFPDHRVIDVALNLTTTCALTSSGTALCVGTPADRDEPIRHPLAISGVSDAIAIEVSWLRGCVLDANGHVSCWRFAENATRALDASDPDFDEDSTSASAEDDSTATDPARAHRLRALGRAIDIALGDEFVCALRPDGTIACVGNRHPHINDLSIRLDPDQPKILPDIDDAITIDARGEYLCVVRADGSVACLGNPPVVALRDSSIEPPVSPQRIIGLRDIQSVSVASDSACALSRAGTAHCWGHNQFGEFGFIRKTPPFQIVAGIRARRLMLADHFSCALTSVGDRLCWGLFARSFPERGILEQSRPGPMPSVPARDIQALASSSRGRCALQRNRSVRCWSKYTQGDDPAHHLELSDVAQLVGRFSTTACARRDDGTVWCWGRSLGNLGDGRQVRSSAPVQVKGIVDATFVATSSSYGCAVGKAGALWCWGRFRRYTVEREGIVAIPEKTAGKPRYRNESATRVPGFADAVSVAGNDAAICVRTKSQRVRCWHRDHELPPGRDMGLSATAELVATTRTICARTFAGQVYCWRPDDLQPHKAASRAPRPGPYPRPLSVLRAGRSHLCGMRQSGRVVCWGDNRVGQLGVPPATVELTPVQAFSLAPELRDIGPSDL